MTDGIDITGLKLWDVLAALYNNTGPLGLGCLAPGSMQTMTGADAYEMLDLDLCEQQIESPHGLSFDYVRGRPIKVNFKHDGDRTTLYRARFFDRDSFRPAADVIADLRSEAGE